MLNVFCWWVRNPLWSRRCKNFSVHNAR